MSKKGHFLGWEGICKIPAAVVYYELARATRRELEREMKGILQCQACQVFVSQDGVLGRLARIMTLFLSSRMDGWE